jgi:hypothetical protein
VWPGNPIVWSGISADLAVDAHWLSSDNIAENPHRTSGQVRKTLLRIDGFGPGGQGPLRLVRTYRESAQDRNDR